MDKPSITMNAGFRDLSVILILLMAIPLATSVESPFSVSESQLMDAVDFILSNQNDDGGFGPDSSSLSSTRLAVEVLSAVGLDPLDYENGGLGVDDYLLSVSDDVHAGVSGSNPLTERVNMVLALSACGLNASDFGGHDHFSALAGEQNSSTGCFGGGASDTAYSIIALRAGGLDEEDSRLQYALDCLLSLQLDDGSFEYSSGMGGDSNTLSLSIMAMSAMGYGAEELDDGLEALGSFQNTTNGGFFFQSTWGTDPDVSSTAFCVNAILAEDGDPTAGAWASGEDNPVNYLVGMQNKDTGEFMDPWSTYRPTCLAVSSLSGKPVPGLHLVGEVFVFPALVGIIVLLGRLNGGQG